MGETREPYKYVVALGSQISSVISPGTYPLHTACFVVLLRVHDHSCQWTDRLTDPLFEPLKKFDIIYRTQFDTPSFRSCVPNPFNNSVDRDREMRFSRKFWQLMWNIDKPIRVRQGDQITDGILLFVRPIYESWELEVSMNIGEQGYVAVKTFHEGDVEGVSGAFELPEDLFVGTTNRPP